MNPAPPSGPEEVRTSLPLAFLALLVLVAAAVVALAAPIGAWWYHRQNDLDAEIAWVESFRPVTPWRAAVDASLDRLYRERVEVEIRAGRLDRAVQAMRLARRRVRSLSRPADPRLTAIGLETYTRASDRLARGGRLLAAADWCDTLFVFAVRDPDQRSREQAVAAFMEGLELRVRARQPCAALARLQWAKRGLGGEVPSVGPAVETDLARRCAAAQGGSR